MATIDISASDVTSAENFLEEYLTDSIPDGDFSKGTGVRDLTVGAIAAIYAFLKSENAKVQNMQSLQTVENAVDETDTAALDDAVTSILSNWFITRKPGSKARGTIVCHTSQLGDVFIRTSVKFNKTTNLSFVVDATDTYFVPQEDLIPIVNSDGVILEYQFNVPIVAVGTGDGYNIDPGLFVSFDAFNAFVTRVENLDKFSGGRGPETTQELLNRAPTAISVRNLINEKSINAVLEEEFPDIRSLIVTGYGDQEMTRDVLTGVAQHLAIHVGGATDVYVDSDVSTTSFSGTVGGEFDRPDGKVVIFKDPTFTGAVRLFTDSPAVEVGDLIRVTAGFDSVPAEFRVIEVEDERLTISDRTPFAKATDEEADPGDQNIEYSVGRAGPTYTDIISTQTTGLTTRKVSTSGRITLPGGPIYGIADVAVIDPDVSEPFKDPSDGFVHFSERVNETPENIVDPEDTLQYQVVIHNPKVAQSNRQWAEIVVGPDGDTNRWDGKTLRVTYKTLPLLNSVTSFVENKFERVVCADVLSRGFYAVTLSMSINLKLKSTALAVPDADEIVSNLVSFINDFDTSSTPIDISAIMEYLRTNYTDIGTITPFSISYFLSVPDGTFVTYSTTDEVIVDSSKQIDGPSIDLTTLGITTKLLKYFSSENNITITIS